ncbi:MAG: J domain-containing protein, partial [Hyphomicrobium sp.]
MKLNSKYFDSIRVSSKRANSDTGSKNRAICQYNGCKQPATHRAPKGRGRDGEYFNFCVAHVKEYNSAYNYFDGMSDNEVASFQKDALTGHRPTWKVAANSWIPGMREKKTSRLNNQEAPSENDASAFFAWRVHQSRSSAIGKHRQLRPLEKKALVSLGLRHGATEDEIKLRYKELVKLHHPDANGGDRASEERLREI